MDQATSSFNSARSVFFDGKVDDDSIAELRQRVIELWEGAMPKTPIDLYINSSGGYGEPAFGFFRFVRDILQCNLRTINVGTVGSAAVILFMAGSERLMTKGSEIFMHLGRRAFEGEQLTRIQLCEETKSMERAESRYRAIILEALPEGDEQLTEGHLFQMMSSDNTFISSEKARELSLATGVIE